MGGCAFSFIQAHVPDATAIKPQVLKPHADDDGDDEDVSDDDDLEFCLFLLPLLLLYTSASEDFLAGLARGATRSALAAELAEAAQAGNAPGGLEARLWESREVWVSRQISDLGFRFRAEVGPRGFMKMFPWLGVLCRVGGGGVHGREGNKSERERHGRQRFRLRILYGAE